MITLTDLKTGDKYTAETYTEIARMSGFKYGTIASVVSGHTNSNQFKVESDGVRVGRSFGEIKGQYVDTAQAIREIIKKNNTSIRDLADRVGCAKGTIEKMVKGYTVPSATILKELCLEFNVSADYVLGLTNYKTLY